MRFLELPVAETLQCYLAHSCRVGQRRVAKGTQIDAGLIEQLHVADIHTVTVAQLDASDVHEDAAAQELALALSGQHVTASTARTGRVNLHADAEGLFLFSRDTLLALNAVDERITCATLDENRWVTKGRMLATIKIIPYAVPREQLNKVLGIVAQASQPLSIHVAHSKTVALIQTRLPSLKETVLDKTFEVTRQRLQQRGSLLLLERRCKHNTQSLSTTIEDVMKQSPDCLIIAGASAISDRADVIPQSIELAGGSVQRFGIPIDPGNLLLLAEIKDTTVLGAPGCARSPKDNGLDRVLDRLVCELPVHNDWLNTLSIGGLLDEDVTRPALRREASPVRTGAAQLRIGALVLAAGHARQVAGRTHSTSIRSPLDDWQGKPIVEQVLSQLEHTDFEQAFERILVVTGQNDPDIADLSIKDTTILINNPDWEKGLGYSIAAGVRQLLDCDAIMVFLGNTPPVSTSTLEQLRQHYLAHPETRMLVPNHRGKSGNPVLINNVFFDSLLALRGDSGARFIQRCYPDSVKYLEVDDPMVLGTMGNVHHP